MSETGYSLKEIADFLDAELFGDPSLKIVGICSLNNSIKDHLTFLSEQKNYQDSGRNSVLVFLSFFYYFGLRKKSYFIKINKAIYKFKEKIKEKIK